MIDRLRKELSQRLDRFLAEAEKLRRARAARAARARGGPPPTLPESPPQPEPARPPRPAAKGQRVPAAGPTRERTAPGATKTQVLSALTDGQAMTAGEVAAVTGLARATVSTTLSRLAKTGDVLKAERGYRLPPSGEAPSAPEHSDGA